MDNQLLNLERVKDIIENQGQPAYEDSDTIWYSRVDGKPTVDFDEVTNLIKLGKTGAKVSTVVELDQNAVLGLTDAELLLLHRTFGIDYDYREDDDTVRDMVVGARRSDGITITAEKEVAVPEIADVTKVARAFRKCAAVVTGVAMVVAGVSFATFFVTGSLPTESLQSLHHLLNYTPHVAWAQNAVGKAVDAVIGFTDRSFMIFVGSTATTIAGLVAESTSKFFAVRACQNKINNELPPDRPIQVILEKIASTAPEAV